VKAKAMRELAHAGCHDCAPAAWRKVPKVTGDYDLDATIMHRKDTDLPDRIRTHLSGPRTAYTAYHNYHGDD
jgi:hypothetical protein